ncbi:MAG: hypothetical protein Q4D88_01255 [Anaerococcus sp.]|nr:hypothetical protein [Anaerococcus sp.]
MNKKTITIMLAYVGVLTGAGLASGQELLQYFVSLGLPGIAGIAVVGLLHMLIGGLILQLGSHYLANDHSDVFDEITNKFISKFIDLSLIFTCFVVGFVMIAGAGSNLNQAFGTKTWMGALICAILVIGIGMLDFSKVSKIIGSFTPLIIAFTILASIYTFIKFDPNWTDLESVALRLPSNFNNIGLSVVNYFGMCIMTGISMAFVLGGDEINTKEAGKGGLLGGLIVGILGVLIVLTLFIRIDDVGNLDIPMLYIVGELSPILGTIMSVVIFGMIFNTAISLFYALARRFSSGSEKRFRVILIGLTLAGFILSFAGFKELVSIFYPIIGYIGMVMLLVLVFAYFREREAISHESKKRFAMTHYMRKKFDEDKDYTKEDASKFKKLVKSSIIDDKLIAQKAEERAKEQIDNDSDD